MIADGRNSNTSGVAQGYANTIIGDFSRNWLAQKGSPGAVQVTTRAWFNAQLETRWTMVPSLIGTITMMMTMLLTAMSVAREREEGTFDQLLVAPFTATEIMVGKAVPSMIVGIVQASVVLLLALFWFRIPFAGRFAALYLGLALFLAAAIGFGLFLSSLAGNMQQAMVLCFLFLMPFMLLSGLMSPTDNMPKVLQIRDRDQSVEIRDIDHPPRLPRGRACKPNAPRHVGPAYYRRSHLTNLGLDVHAPTELEGSIFAIDARADQRPLSFCMAQGSQPVIDS